VQICPTCADAVRDKAARSFAEVSEALTLARQEYSKALAGHRRDPDDTEAIRKANARVDAASLAYAKALSDYRAFLRQVNLALLERPVDGESVRGVGDR
jgi:hypothetical protein